MKTSLHIITCKAPLYFEIPMPRLCRLFPPASLTFKQRQLQTGNGKQPNKRTMRIMTPLSGIKKETGKQTERAFHSEVGQLIALATAVLAAVLRHCHAEM